METKISICVSCFLCAVLMHYYLAIYPIYCVQYLHPLAAEGYRETVRALRAIGRDCIQKRIRTIKSGEQPPHDILSHILKVISK